MEKRNSNMKRHCKDIKKIMGMKWRSLTSTKSAARRTERDLKKHQIIQARKNRNLKKPDGQPKKVPKPPEFVDADSDDSDDEQEPTPKQPQKASKASEFVDDEQSPVVKCIVMYSTEDEQEPTVKQPQKA